jgi:hypothetical protein
VVKFSKRSAGRPANVGDIPKLEQVPVLVRKNAVDPNGNTVGALISSKYKVVPTIPLPGNAGKSGFMIYAVPEQSSVVKTGPLAVPPVKNALALFRVKNVPLRR